MIAHLAIVEFEPARVGLEELRGICTRINSLEALDSVERLSAGLALDRQGGELHKVALYGLFRSEDDLDRYLAHPDHLAVGAAIRDLEPLSISGADFLVS